jgi:glutamate---cysteine ligase / carboxylate-amine ligase
MTGKYPRSRTEATSVRRFQRSSAGYRPPRVNSHRPDRSAPHPSDRAAFDHAVDGTVGAEEELFLLDPDSLDLIPLGEVLVEALGDRERFRRELSAAQIEIVTGAGHSGADLALQLADGRRRVIEQSAGRARLLGAGAHPFAALWGDLSSGPRYEALLADHALGARLGALAAGLHVHVAIKGAERAVAVYNGLRELMPLLIALGANAPFIAGQDSGLATVRCALSDALPRHGTGPWLPDWQAFESFVGWGRRTGLAPDPSQYWWDCRLNPRTGTVEVRSPDVQPSIDDAEALVAIVQAAALDIVERHDAGESPQRHSAIVIDENRWRAARQGLSGELLDFEAGAVAPTRDLVSELLDRLDRTARRCGGERAIRHARAMVQIDIPDTLRAIARSDGMLGVCEWLAARTERAALRDDSPAKPSGTHATWTSGRRSPPTRTVR